MSIVLTATPPALVTATPPMVSSPTTPPAVSTPTTGTNSIVLSGFAGPVISLAWSPDGQTLATGVGNPEITGLPGVAGGTPNAANYTFRLWQADGTPKATLTGHTGPVDGLAWSPDGKTLASGSTDATMRLWDSAGTPVRTVNCNKGTVYTIAWSPDGSTIATGSIASPSQNTVQIWKPNGTLLHTLTTDYSGSKFYNLAWSPDGKYLVGGAVDYKIWSADGTELGHVAQCAHCTPAWGMAWSPDSTKWATGDESGFLEFYDLHANPVQELRGTASINALVWSPDGKLIAGGTGLWSSDGTHLNSINATMGTGINTLAWSPDSRTLAAGSDNKIVGLFDTQGIPKTTLKGHTDRVLKVAWSPDGKTLASGAIDQTVRLWKVGTNR